VNTVNNIKRFVFLNRTENYSFEKPFYPGINMSILLRYNSKNNNKDSFHFYVIKSGAIPNLDVISNNPAVINKLSRYVVPITVALFVMNITNIFHTIIQKKRIN
jgi:hypothetical protein